MTQDQIITGAAVCMARSPRHTVIIMLDISVVVEASVIQVNRDIVERVACAAAARVLSLCEETLLGR